MTEKQIKLTPIGWKPSLLIFLVTATIFRVVHYTFIPAYISITKQPYLIGYLIGWVSTMFLVFVASLIAYKLEGHPISWKVFVARYRLGHLIKADGLWILAMILFSIAGFAALLFTRKWLVSMPLTAPHPVFPPDFVDFFNNTPGVLFEMTLKGEWWIGGVYFVGWLLNIMGEEFWYRGWMLPGQELAIGKYAWVVNGLMFNFQHTFQPWNLLAILPGSLFVSFAVQR